MAIKINGEGFQLWKVPIVKAPKGAKLDLSCYIKTFGYRLLKPLVLEFVGEAVVLVDCAGDYLRHRFMCGCL